MVFDVNCGFAAANNRAIVTCDTDFAALLNPDAFPVPDCLEHLMAAAISNPGVAAFSSLQLFADISNKIDGMGDSYRMSGCFGVRNTGFCCCQLLKRSAPCSAPERYRLDALLEVGEFDEDFFCFVEDVDLGFRLRLAVIRPCMLMMPSLGL